jgi:hypothetical protein
LAIRHLAVTPPVGGTLITPLLFREELAEPALFPIAPPPAVDTEDADAVRRQTDAPAEQWSDKPGAGQISSQIDDQQQVDQYMDSRVDRETPACHHA